MLISYHHKCPVHIGWAGCSQPSRIAAMSHLFTMIFFILEVSPHQSLANVLTSPFFKIFCHRSACRSNTIYCGSLLVAKLHFPFVSQFFFPTEPCSVRREVSVTFPAAFKRRVVTISNQLGARLYVNEGCAWARWWFRKCYIFQGWLLAGVLLHIWLIPLLIPESCKCWLLARLNN